MQLLHSKLYCLCSRDIQNFIVCAVATFKTLLFVQWRHSKLYCLCSRDVQNFIVCAVETFKTLLFVQSRHSKLYCLCSRAIRNFLVCVSLLGLRTFQVNVTQTKPELYLVYVYLQYFINANEVSGTAKVVLIRDRGATLRWGGEVMILEISSPYIRN